MRQTIAKGLIGQVLSAHLSVHWNHDWVAKTPFNKVHHVILYDFAIHWFDILNCFMSGRPAKRVYASIAPARGQTAAPPLLGQAIVEYDDSQASLSFDGFARFGPQDRTYIAGAQGSMSSIGPDLGRQTLTIQTPRGQFTPILKGSWFPDGFHGTMAELLCSIEENRQPFNNARDNLKGLATCFAATRSADTGKPQVPGKVQRLSDG
jgi:predicted dehydrogenase